jgi:hypothetical protein
MVDISDAKVSGNSGGNDRRGKMGNGGPGVQLVDIGRLVSDPGILVLEKKCQRLDGY